MPASLTIERMNRIFPSLFLSGALLTSCADFSNRVYRYGEEVPVQPFVLKLTQTEYGLQDNQLVLKLTLQAANRSNDENNLSRNRFVLRVGQSREIKRDLTFLESLGMETISFKKGEDATVTVSFVLSQDSLQEKFALIVDRQPKDGRELLTLIQVKDASPPKSLPTQGEWRIARSTRWG